MQLSNVCGLLIASSHDLTCIQRFKVLSEAERTVALYSLSQHSTQVQLHFFITVLQQMAGPTPLLLSEPGRRGFRAEPDCNGHYNRKPDLGRCGMWWNVSGT